MNRDFVVYYGTDNLDQQPNRQIEERRDRCYGSLEKAKERLNNISLTLKKQVKETKAPVRFFAYILGYDESGVYKTLVAHHYRTRKYCMKRGLRYVEIE